MKSDATGRKVFSGNVLLGNYGIFVKLLQNLSDDGIPFTSLHQGNIRNIEVLDKFMHHDLLDGSRRPIFSCTSNLKLILPFTTELMHDVCRLIHQWSPYFLAFAGGSEDNMLVFLDQMMLSGQKPEDRVFDDQFDIDSFKNGGNGCRNKVVSDAHNGAARYIELFHQQGAKYLFFVSRFEHHPSFHSEQAWLNRTFPGLTSIHGFINPILVPDSSHPTLDVASPVRNSVCTPIRPSESSLVFTPKDDSSSDDDFEMDDGVFVLKERSRDTTESETSSKIQQEFYRAESPLEPRTKKRRVAKEGDMVLFANDRGNIDGNNEAYEIAGRNALFSSETEESHSEQEEEEEDDVRNGEQQARVVAQEDDVRNGEQEARVVAPVNDVTDDSASEGDEADNEFEEESE